MVDSEINEISYTYREENQDTEIAESEEAMNRRSEKRYQEALSAYKQAKLVWRGESRVKEER